MKIAIATAIGLTLSVLLVGSCLVIGEDDTGAEIVDAFAVKTVNGDELRSVGKDTEFFIKAYIYINTTSLSGEYQLNITLSKEDGSITDLLYGEGFIYSDDKQGYAIKTLVVNTTDWYYPFLFPLKSKDDSGTLHVEATLLYNNATGLVEVGHLDGYDVPIGKTSGSCLQAIILPLGILSIGLVYYERDRKKDDGG